RLIRDPADLDLVRLRLHDPDWRVRVQAANVLGRWGGPQDLHGLLALLAAPEWWVRYRAAQAIVALPFMQAEALARIAHELGDPYARDMLRQAMSEKEGA
ncbi:MAG TPA: HEAT repeat domain-containing protein, partial [Methylophilaceae bacterium]|nr:HEAT repeat domain-containing protein [Methylophilaceae bacterium]